MRICATNCFALPRGVILCGQAACGLPAELAISMHEVAAGEEHASMASVASRLLTCSPVNHPACSVS